MILIAILSGEKRQLVLDLNIVIKTVGIFSRSDHG